MGFDFNPLNRAVLKTFADSEADEFGPVTVDGVEVEAIYDSRHLAVELGEGPAASTLITAIVVAAAIAEAVTVEETPIVARGVTYRATDKQLAGAGMVLIQLRKVP